MFEWQGNADHPEFDLALAKTYVGKTILIGVSYLDHTGKPLEQVQMHGVIESVGPEGINVSLRGKRAGESWMMPPTLESLTPAKPGVYKLHSTGEEIHDPDLLTTWSVKRPLQH